jgi:hypothetical protein
VKREELANEATGTIPVYRQLSLRRHSAGWLRGTRCHLVLLESVAEFRTAELDFVVTLCDNGAQTCPLWLGSGRVKHIGFPDPAIATGSEDERLEVFRQVRDGIRQEVMHYLEEMEVGSNDKAARNL